MDLSQEYGEEHSMLMQDTKGCWTTEERELLGKPGWWDEMHNRAVNMNPMINSARYCPSLC